MSLFRGSPREADKWGSMQPCVDFFTMCGSTLVPTTIAGVGDSFKTCCVDNGHEEGTCQNIKDEMLRKHTDSFGSGLCEELQELAKEHELWGTSADQSLHNRRKSREAQTSSESHEHSADNLDTSLAKKEPETPSPTPIPTPSPTPPTPSPTPSPYVAVCAANCLYCEKVTELACPSMLLETSTVKSLHNRRQMREIQNTFEPHEQSAEELDASVQQKEPETPSAGTPAPPTPSPPIEGVPPSMTDAVAQCSLDCAICLGIEEEACR